MSTIRTVGLLVFLTHALLAYLWVFWEGVFGPVPVNSVEAACAWLFLGMFLGGMAATYPGGSR